MELGAKFIPLSKIIKERNQNPRTALTAQQERHLEILTEEMAAFSRNIGVDMMIMAIVLNDA